MTDELGGTRPCDCGVCEGEDTLGTNAENFVRELRSETHDNADAKLRDAADFIEAQQAKIERLQLELDAEWRGNHAIMWQDTLIPLAEAASVSLVGLDGNKRQFQMVDDIVAEIKRLRAVVDAMLERPFRGSSDERRYRMYGSDWAAVHDALDAIERGVEADD